MELKDSVLSKLNELFSPRVDDVLRYRNKLCVPNVEDLRSSILEKGPGSRYSIHPGSTKIYHDL